MVSWRHSHNAFSLFDWHTENAFWNLGFSQKGPINLFILVHPCVSLEQVLLGIRSLVFFWIMTRWYLVKIKNTSKDSALRKKYQNGPKLVLFAFFEKLVFPGNNLKWKIVLFFKYQRKSLIFPNSGFQNMGPKCFWRIRL